MLTPVQCIAQRRRGLVATLPATLLGLLLGVFLGLAGCEDRAPLQPGARAPAAPQQLPVSDPVAIAFGDHYELLPRAQFAITARVLGKRRYRWDRLADVAPWDLAMGWGIMSDDTVLARLALTQGDRFLFRKRLDRHMPIERIDASSANLHVIPADERIARTIAALREHRVVTLRGVLVDVRSARDGWSVRTSLSRTDSGAGACEILLVQDVMVQETRAEQQNAT